MEGTVYSLKNRFFAELFGTYMLVFCGTGAIVINEVSGGTVGHLGIALTFGLVVMGMIYALGEISGAHMNPAVTLSFLVAGKFNTKELLPFLGAQFAGAIAASFTLKALFPEALTLGETLPAGSDIQSFVLEFILTFILMFVIIHVATGSRQIGTMAGIAIGGIVALEAAFAGPICGASMNPARSLGPALVNLQLESLWVYLVAPTLGAIAAVFTCKLLKGKNCC